MNHHTDPSHPAPAASQNTSDTASTTLHTTSPAPTPPTPARSRSLNRRHFLSRVGGITAAAVAAGTLGLEAHVTDAQTVQAAEQAAPASAAQTAPASTAIGPLSPTARRDQAYTIRVNAAIAQRDLPIPEHPDNGDEAAFSNRLANYTKALPHDSQGIVTLSAYNALITALSTGTPSNFEAIPLGGLVRLTNPQAAYAYELEGPDSHQLPMPAAPTFRSAEEAGEMVELYWHALARDVPFANYGSDALIGRAVTGLSALSDFRGPKNSTGQVTRENVFRGGLAGDLVGPYISQFLWQDIPYGIEGLLGDRTARTVAQRYVVPPAGDDFMQSVSSWLSIQNGTRPSTGNAIGPNRYISTGRDLAEYVHRDFPQQAFLNACLILLALGAPFDANHPYRGYQKQDPFVTFGASDVIDSVTRVVNEALKAAWYQKWLVHRRLRPEEFGGRVHFQRTGAASYPIHPDLLNASVLSEVSGYNQTKTGAATFLLPQAYPEGAPTHPAYPSGHATYVGAAATVLKAFFDESWVLPSPVVASADGTTLNAYTGPALTVGGELNKLASNIAIGRDWAGVHWRTDALEGLRLGELLALGVLNDRRRLYNETFTTLSVTRLDGTQRFVKGVNFNGPAVTIEGNRWLSYTDALANGLSTNANRTTSSLRVPVSDTDTDTTTMLSSGIWWFGAGTLNIQQTLPNGRYKVYVWIIENNDSNRRSLALHLQGNQVAGGVGNLGLNFWAKYGPFDANVVDGVLRLDVVAPVADPHIMGMAIFQ